jgi:general bacterial porin, GBP family
MKKNLIALAILGAFSGAALAQSNVTLYGIIDVGFQYIDPDVSGASSTRGINSGIQSGSRWGIRGAEALSPNLNAVFTLEGGFNTDDGTQLGTKLFGRQVWAGLSGGWGTLVAGRVATFSSGTGSFDMIGNVDPFATGFNDAAAFSTFGIGTLRVDNSVLYQSPSWGGFKFGAGYSFNALGQENAGSGSNNRVAFFGANFTRGPFWAGITYDIIDLNDAGFPAVGSSPAIFPNASDQKRLIVGATFDLKFLKIHGGYAKEDNAVLTSALATQGLAGEDADAWLAGVTVPLLGGSVLASYQTRSGDSVNVCTGAFVPATNGCSVALVTREGDRDVWAIAYTYPLSRRTNLYTAVVDSDGEGFNNNNVAVDRRTFSAGIRHLF